jgi:hypothetical protein
MKRWAYHKAFCYISFYTILVGFRVRGVGVVSFRIYSQGFSMSGFSNFQGFSASGFSVVQGFSVSGFSVVQGLTVLNLLSFKRRRSSVDTAKCWTKKGSGYKVRKEDSMRLGNKRKKWLCGQRFFDWPRLYDNLCFGGHISVFGSLLLWLILAFCRKNIILECRRGRHSSMWRTLRIPALFCPPFFCPPFLCPPFLFHRRFQIALLLHEPLPPRNIISLQSRNHLLASKSGSQKTGNDAGRRLHGQR